RTLFVSAAAAALLTLSGAAFAQQAVHATTDLNVRAGPGPEYPVIGSIPIDGEAMLHGCIEGSRWCQVTAGSLEGWAYSDYLIADNSGVEVVLTERPPAMDVPVVTYRDSDAPGGVVGSVAGGAT